MYPRMAQISLSVAGLSSLEYFLKVKLEAYPFRGTPEISPLHFTNTLDYFVIPTSIRQILIFVISQLLKDI